MTLTTNCLILVKILLKQVRTEHIDNWVSVSVSITERKGECPDDKCCDWPAEMEWRWGGDTRFERGCRRREWRVRMRVRSLRLLFQASVPMNARLKSFCQINTVNLRSFINLDLIFVFCHLWESVVLQWQCEVRRAKDRSSFQNPPNCASSSSQWRSWRRRWWWWRRRWRWRYDVHRLQGNYHLNGRLYGESGNNRRPGPNCSHSEYLNTFQ